MRAIVVRQYGGPENLEVADVPTPEPGSGEILVKVAAAGLNPVDAAVRAGYFGGRLGDRPTTGFGWDVAGTVESTGSGVTQFVQGDSVIALLNGSAVEFGTHAEYVVVPAAAAALAPSSVAAPAAATLPLNALTADQALDLLALEPGQTVLVTGAAGAVGGYVVPLAHRRGLRVVATASATDEATVRGFGADVFVPRSEKLADAVRDAVPGGVDGAIDAAQIGVAALDAVRDGGRFIPVTDPAIPEAARGITVEKVEIEPDGQRLAELARLVDAGELTLRVATTLPFADAAEAHRLLEKGGLRGRIVLVP
ncbi:MAG: NADPH:quinone reductase [Actinomycetota bacterium]|jgi:NADPH:quinone reductase-like Zn-dependent oxidoreductase|nr:NADPH:quinone reductase [Actinomycetota bacterium]